MNIYLSFDELSKCLIELPEKECDESVESVLIYLCSFLGGKLALKVDGFGQDRWPVCSDTDTADVLIQLPNVLKSLKDFSYFEIVFSEQALSRRLEFYPDRDNRYKIQCLSWGNWIANPAEEMAERLFLFNSFHKLFLNFIDGLGEMSPQTLNNYWIDCWIKQIEQERL